MKESLLLEGEQIITQSDKSIITLTNMRLRYNGIGSNKGYVMSLFLEKISHIEIRYKSHGYLLYLAILIVAGCFTVAFIDHHFAEIIPVGIGVAALLVIIFFITRHHEILVTTDGGGKMSMHTRGMKSEKVFNFINQIEKATTVRRSNLN